MEGRGSGRKSQYVLSTATTTNDNAHTPIRYCSHCNRFKPLTAEYWSKDKRKAYGLRYICKWCRHYQNYQLTAKSKNIELTITREQAEILFGSPCFYCGCKPAGGIDRVDNGIGYTASNVVPCCWECNAIKKNHSLPHMINHLGRILTHLGAIDGYAACLPDGS